MHEPSLLDTLLCQHTYTCIQPRIRTGTHIYIYICTPTCKYKRMHIRTKSHRVCAHTLMHIDAHSLAYSHVLTRAFTFTHTHSYTFTHECKFMHAHSCTLTVHTHSFTLVVYTHSCTHTHPRTFTHLHTHTHPCIRTRAYICSYKPTCMLMHVR